MDAPFRSGFRIVLRLVAVGLAFFLLLEASARVYFFGWKGLVPARINSVHGMPQTGFTTPSSLRGVPFEFAPEIDGYFKLEPFRTNSQGLRDREYSVEKPPDTFRVAVIGSSFALPAGVAIEDAFHSRLEERFSEEFAPTRVEFINFSIGMLNARHMLAVLEQRALAYAPDLVLFCTTRLSEGLLLDAKPEQTVSPAEARARAAEVKDPLNWKKSYPILQSFFLRLVAERTREEAGPPRFHVGALERRYMALADRFAAPRDAAAAPPPAPAPASPRLADDRRVLERLAWNAQRSGIPIVIVRLEFDLDVTDDGRDDLARRARELGLRHFDTREAFRGTRARDFWIYEFDPHPNAAAHEIFARAIARFLRAEGLLPVPQATTRPPSSPHPIPDA